MAGCLRLTVQAFVTGFVLGAGKNFYLDLGNPQRIPKTVIE